VRREKVEPSSRKGGEQKDSNSAPLEGGRKIGMTVMKRGHLFYARFAMLVEKERKKALFLWGLEGAGRGQGPG